MENKRGLIVTIQQVIGRVKSMLVDSNNNPVGVTGNPLVVTGSGSGGSSDVNVHSGSGTSIGVVGDALKVNYTNTTEATAAKQDIQTTLLQVTNSLLPTVVYDNLVLGYTGSNLTTVEYKNGATVLMTLTLSYDGSDNLIGVVKS